jgi:predicted permease
MRIVSRIKRLYSNVRRRGHLEYSLDEELRAYVDEIAGRNAARGMPRAEARRQALLEVGGVEQVKEQTRDQWLGHGIQTVLQDITYASRSLSRSPGFTIVVVATLALGIGANVTIFGLARAVLWRPLPYPEPDRIVSIQVDARNVPNTGATTGEIFDLQERSRSLEQVSMINAVDANLEYQGEIEHLQAASVSDNLLPLLGAHPALGRTLDSHIDESKDHVLAILISDSLWRRRFAADPDIIGTTVLVNNTSLRIVGVLPRSFRLFLSASVSASENIDIWFPGSISPTRQYRGIPVVARLRHGVTIAQANAELQTLAAQFEREYPEFYSGGKGWQASPSDGGTGGAVHFTAVRLQDEITHEARPALFLLAGAVGFVLLIACVNAANLLLARGSARQRELEIRRALGAGRIRLIRQLLTESLLLALSAAVIGLFCAQLGLRVLERVHNSHIPLQSRIGMDPAVVFAALGLSMLASVLFGLLPAWRMAAGSAGTSLRAGRTETASAGTRRLQRALVVVEVAVSIVLLASSGLMLRSFLNLLHTPLGFDPVGIVTAKVPLSLRKYSQMEQRWALLRDILDRVRAIPGVKGVSSAGPLPLAGDQQTRRVGRTDRPDTPPILATQQGAIPGYLHLIGTPLIAGREFRDTDVAPRHKVAIVDERLAKRLWPEGAIGKRLTVYRTGWHDDMEIIGVTKSVRVTRVRDKNIPHFIMPDEYPGSLVIRTHETAAQIAPLIQSALKSAHVGRAAFEIRPMTDYVADSIGDTRFMLLVLAAFAAASVLLAAAGLYGTLSYLTAQRTREFGIRIALGASVRAIVAIVIRESVLLAIAGVVLGISGVAAVSGAIRELLYGVEPLDRITLISVAGLVGFLALVAAAVPAWKAATVNPQRSLQAD